VHSTQLPNYIAGISVFLIPQYLSLKNKNKNKNKTHKSIRAIIIFLKINFKINFSPYPASLSSLVTIGWTAGCSEMAAEEAPYPHTGFSREDF
jgi:hypothetical protein